MSPSSAPSPEQPSPTSAFSAVPSGPSAAISASTALPAEVLYLIADNCFNTYWTDHELWFQLGQTSRVFRDAVVEHVRKSFASEKTALHTRFEQHCKGRIIRDQANVNRIETLVTVPVYLQTRCRVEKRTEDDDDEEIARDHDDGREVDASGRADDNVDGDEPATDPAEANSDSDLRQIATDWTFRNIDENDRWLAVFETSCSSGQDQDILDHHIKSSSNNNGSTHNTASPPSPSDPFPPLRFTTKALSLLTAESGKIDFDDIPLRPASLRSSDANPRTNLVAVDWREIWARKLGRERFVQARQTEKMREWKAKVEKTREEVMAKRKVAMEERRVAEEERKKGKGKERAEEGEVMGKLAAVSV